MTAFDVIVLAVVILSTLVAFLRGVVRELISLGAWIAGIVAAVAYSSTVAEMLSGLQVMPVIRHVIAFALILVAALIAGALISFVLRNAVHAIGLGFVDRFLGGAFGLARGVLVVMAFVLVAGLTTMPKENWWQNSLLGEPLAEAALALSPWLPPEWAQRLDYSPGRGPRPATTATAGAFDEDDRPCAAS